MENLCKEIIVQRSQDTMKEYLFTPAVVKLPSGRLIMSYDISDRIGKVLISDDSGETWVEKATRKFYHAHVIVDGSTVYLLGHTRVEKNNELVIFVSHDEGETWSEGDFLSQGEYWQGSACELLYRNGYVYLCMDQVLRIEGEFPVPFWPAHIMAPVVLRGKLGTDLTKRENWLFSQRIRYCDLIDDDQENDYGMPFLPTSLQRKDLSKCAGVDEYKARYDYENDRPTVELVMNPGGWLEGNMVEIHDPHHFWYDHTGKSLLIFMRAHTGFTNYACVMKAVERIRDGHEVIDIEPIYSPSGKRMIFLPFPGGQMRFHVKYDPVSKLYWLASTQAVDSMTKLEYLHPERYNLPNDERDRLVLHFSKNMVDWVFAGLIAKGNSPKESRHYASMEIDGDDLLVASRSGDKDAKSPHNGNLITLHRIKNFRNLVY